MSGLNISHFSCPTITLEVGPDKFPIRVPKILLIEASPFFEKALNGNFQESSGDVVPLPTDEPDIVFRLAKWIMTREVDGRHDVDGQDDYSMRYTNTPEEPPHDFPDNSDDDADDGNVSQGSRAEEEEQNGSAPDPATTPNPYHSSIGADALFKLWCLAERLLMPTLQDDVARALVYLVANGSYCPHDPFPGPATLEFVYENSADTARVRDLAVDIAAVTWETGQLKRLSEGLPAVIVSDLFVAATKYWRMETKNHECKRAAFFGDAADAYDVEGLPRVVRTEPALKPPVCHPDDGRHSCPHCGNW